MSVKCGRNPSNWRQLPKARRSQASGRPPGARMLKLKLNVDSMRDVLHFSVDRAGEAAYLVMLRG
jgi:hypothetical protein